MRKWAFRGPANNQFYIHDNSPRDSPKDRPREKQVGKHGKIKKSRRWYVIPLEKIDEHQRNQTFWTILLYSAKRSPLSIILKIFFRFLFPSFFTLLLENTSFFQKPSIAIAHCFPRACPFSRALQCENIKPITSTPPTVIGMQVGIHNALGCIFPFGQRQREREKKREKLRKRKEGESRGIITMPQSL